MSSIQISAKELSSKIDAYFAWVNRDNNFWIQWTKDRFEMDLKNYQSLGWFKRLFTQKPNIEHECNAGIRIYTRQARERKDRVYDILLLLSQVGSGTITLSDKHAWILEDYDALEVDPRKKVMK
jgi:hypothetical protein